MKGFGARLKLLGLALALPACIGVALAASPEEERRKRRLEQERREAQERQREAQQRQREAMERQREAQERQREAAERQQRQREAQERQREAQERQREAMERQREAHERARAEQARREQQQRHEQQVRQQQIQQQQRQAAPQQQYQPPSTLQAAPVHSPSPRGYAPVPSTPAYPVAAPVAAAAAAPYSSAPGPGEGTGQPANDCIQSQPSDGRFNIGNRCREDILVMYCIRPHREPSRCMTAREMSVRTIAAGQWMQESTPRDGGRIMWFACRDGYKPEFSEPAGDNFRARCLLGDDMALLRDWAPMTTAAAGGAPTLDVCIHDHECEDGDILAVSVNGREIMREELLNRQACRRVNVNHGANRISIFAVNGSGFKGNCSYKNRNTGQITVYGLNPDGSRGPQQAQSWRVPGGAGSSSTMVVNVR